jgi:nitrogen fixation-related uncharacterized protein
MNITLQSIYFFIGVGGIAIGIILAIVAVIYFFRADIRGVKDDLSGKAKQIEMEKAATEKTKKKKRVLTNKQEWTGGVAQGSIEQRSTTSGTDSSASTDATFDTDYAAGGNKSNKAKSFASVSTKSNAIGARGTTSDVAFQIRQKCLDIHHGFVIDVNGGLSKFE